MQRCILRDVACFCCVIFAARLPMLHLRITPVQLTPCSLNAVRCIKVAIQRSSHHIWAGLMHVQLLFGWLVLQTKSVCLCEVVSSTSIDVFELQLHRKQCFGLLSCRCCLHCLHKCSIYVGNRVSLLDTPF